MIKFILLYLGCFIYCGASGQSDTTDKTRLHYHSDVIPDEISSPFEHQDMKPQVEFKKPFDDIKVPDYSTPKRDPVDSILKSLSGSPVSTTTPTSSTISKTEQIQENASQPTQSQDGYFDWNATNADRFVNSTCYKILGFDPKKNPAEQEREYSECEAEYRNKNLVNILIGLLVVSGFFALIYFALKESKPETA